MAEHGILELVSSDELGLEFRLKQLPYKVKLKSSKTQTQDIELRLFDDLPIVESMVTLTPTGKLFYRDIPVGGGSGNVDLTNYYTKTESDSRYSIPSGITELSNTYQNSVDGSFYTKNGADWNVQNINNLYTKTQTDSNFATKLELSGYLSKVDASNNYATVGSIPDITGLLPKTEASNTYLSKSDAGNLYLTVSNAGNYLLKTEANLQFQPLSSGLTAYSSSWASDTSQEGKIPQRQGNNLLWVNLPDTTNFVTSAQLTGLLKADGTIQVNPSFTPAQDHDIVYKAWVEQKIASASIGGGTAPDLSTYLLKSEATNLYQLKGTALDALQTSWTSGAADNLKIPQRVGNNINWVTLPDLSGYVTQAVADTRYVASNIIFPGLVSWYQSASNGDILSKDSTDPTKWKKLTLPDLSTYLTKTEASNTYQAKGAALDALQSSWQSGTTQNNKIPQRSGSNLIWIDVPTAPDLSPYLTSATAASTYAPVGASYTKTESDSRYRSTAQTDAQIRTLVYTKTESDTRYQPLGSALTALQTSWATDTSQEGKIPKRIGSSISWVDENSGASGNVDLTPYLTKSEAATTYATVASIPSLSGYYTKTESDVKFALKTAIPDITGLLSKTEASNTYALQSAIPNITGLLPKTEAASTYAPITSLTNYLTVNDAATQYLTKALAGSTYAPLTEFNSVKTATEHLWTPSPGNINLEDRQYTNADLLALKVGWTYTVPETPATDPVDSQTKSKAKIDTLFGITPPVWVNQARLVRITRQCFILTCRTHESAYLYTKGVTSFNYFYEIGFGFVQSSPIGGPTDILSRFSLVGNWVKYVSDQTYQQISTALTAIHNSWANDSSQEGMIPKRVGNDIEWIHPPTGGGSGNVDLTDYFTKTESDARFMKTASYPLLINFSTTGDAANNNMIPRKQGNTFNWVHGKDLGMKILARNQILSADLVLTDTDEQYQFINGGAVARKVTLPVGAPGLFFVIRNTGVQTINVHSSDDTLLSTIYPEYRTALFWGGANWQQYQGINPQLLAKSTVNKQTLTGNLVISPDAATYQYLDPGTANRDVTLPSGFKGAQYVIQNTGVGVFNLVIKNSAGTPLLTTEARWTSFLEWNGVSWEFRQIQDASGVKIYGGSAILSALTIGSTASATRRWVAIRNSAGSLNVGGTPTAARTIDFQDKDGIVALVSDLPVMTGYYTKTEVDNQFTTLQGSLPNMANYLLKADAVSTYTQKVAFDPVDARTQYLSQRQTTVLPDQLYTVDQLKLELSIGTTYTFPVDAGYSKIKEVLGVIPVTGKAQDATLHRLTDQTFLLTYFAQGGTRIESLLTLTDSATGNAALGSTLTNRFHTVLTSDSAGIQNSVGRFSSQSKPVIAGTYALTNNDPGLLLEFGNPCTVTIGMESTAPGSENTIFTKDDEIGLFGSGGAVTLNMSGGATVNDAQTAIVIPRYTCRVLKRFSVKDKWYLF